MHVDSSIFKAYDIRGVYPEQLNEEVAYAVGRAFVSFLTPVKSLLVAICGFRVPQLRRIYFAV